MDFSLTPDPLDPHAFYDRMGNRYVFHSHKEYKIARDAPDNRMASQENYPLLPLDRVTHCICAGMTPLESLSGNLQDVMDQTGCGTFCKICLPYLAQRLAAKSAGSAFSGETGRFSV